MSISEWFSKYIPYSKKWHAVFASVVFFVLGCLGIMVYFFALYQDLLVLHRLPFVIMSGLLTSVLGNAIWAVMFHLTSDESRLLKQFGGLNHAMKAMAEFSMDQPLPVNAACHVKDALRDSKRYCFRAVTGEMVVPKLCMRDESSNLNHVHGCLLAPTWGNYYKLADQRGQERSGENERITAKFVGDMFVEFFYTLEILSCGAFPGRQNTEHISLLILATPFPYIIDHFSVDHSSSNGRGGANGNSMLMYDCLRLNPQAGGLEYYVFPGERKMYDFWQEEFNFLFPDNHSLPADGQEQNVIWIREQKSNVASEKLLEKAKEYYKKAISSLDIDNYSEREIAKETLKKNIPEENPLQLPDRHKRKPPKFKDPLGACERSVRELGSAGTGEALCCGNIDNCPVFPLNNNQTCREV